MPPVTVSARDRAIEQSLAVLSGHQAGTPELGSAPASTGVVTAVRRLPSRAAALVPVPDRLHESLRRALAARGVTGMYTHQADAVEHALAGRHVVIATPTASGKTLCYNAPVLDGILRGGAARALYLFPTKALAQDQLAELHALSEAVRTADAPAIGAFTYDGDTPQDARRGIRTRAHVVLSNPDMLHSGILPHHPRWAKLFENLRFVVLDELHACRGVFGSHVANVLRRLRRVCRHYGSAPTFICTSATIANPRELAEQLTGEPFELVEQSGAPQGEKYFVFVNPPVVNRQLGIRRSYLSEARRVAGEFLRRRLQVIVFAQSRLATEILTTYLKDDFDARPGAPAAIRGYRGGYLPLRRREIERGLREGSVRGVVSTNALELGIDIGALDVAVLAGYPGSIASTWQRAGRAGRRAGRSAAVLVASSAPIDQFVIRNPSYFFGSPPERALINPDNPHLLVDHLKCAAFELPFDAGERFGAVRVQDILEILAEEGFVHFADGRWHWTHESYPADAVSLRSVSSDNFVVVDATSGPKVIGETDFTSGPSTLHQRAIYIVEGQPYEVERFDFENRKAYVRNVDCDYYTDAITHTNVTVLDEFASGAPDSQPGIGSSGPEDGGSALTVRAFTRSHGEVHVVSRVVGFKKIRFYTNENVGSGELDLPEQQMHTTACWLTLPRELMAELPCAPDDRRDGIVGLSYAMRNVAQLLLMCDRRDIGIAIDGAPVERPGGGVPCLNGDGSGLTGEPRIFVYDNYPGGIGFSEPLYGMFGEWLDRTAALVAGCSCESGCPSCVGPDGQTGPLAKSVAGRILDLLGARAGATPPSPAAR